MPAGRRKPKLTSCHAGPLGTGGKPRRATIIAALGIAQTPCNDITYHLPDRMNLLCPPCRLRPKAVCCCAWIRWPVRDLASRTPSRRSGNDGTVRDTIWRRHPGDEWAALEQLPSPVRSRLREHAYDPWSVNALLVWRRYRLMHGPGERGVRAMVRYMDHCERLERRVFTQHYASAGLGGHLPHDAAGGSVLRYNNRGGLQIK